MLIPHEFIYRGDLSAIGDFHSQCFVESLADGNIVGVYFKAAGVTSFTDSWFFGLKVEGVNVLIGTDRPQITAADLDVEKTGFSIAVNFRDKLTPTIDARGTGTVNGPITVIIIVDDGVTVPNIGDPIGSAANNGVLYADGSGDLNQDATRFAYQENEGNQGSLKLGNVSDASVDSGIDISKSLLQVVDRTSFNGNLDHSYFGIFSSIKRGGNNSFFQTSAIRGRATYAGSSPDGPIVTGIEAFVDNQGSTNNSHGLQGLEGNVEAVENANDIQGVAAFGSVADNKTITEFAIGILANMIAGAGSTVPLLIGVRALAGLGGTIAQAIGLLAVISRGTAGVTTNLYGVKIEVDGVTGTVTNSYGIFIPAEIDCGATVQRAIKSLSTALSEFAGPVAGPINAYGAGWNGSAKFATEDAVYDKIESLVLGGGYSDEQAQDAIGAMLDTTLEYVDATPLLRRAALTGDVTAAAGSNATTIANNAVTTAKINNSAVTLPKMADMATASFLGRNTAGTGAPEVLSVNTVRTLLGIADAFTYKGVIDCSANPNYPAADAGDTYKVSVAGKIGGAAGTNVEIGDTLYCLADSTASGTQAGVGASWDILQANIDGAVIGPASSTSGNIATFNGTSGKTIQDGGKALPAGTIVGTSDTQTLTNKRVTGRVDSAATSATPTPNADSDDVFVLTALNAAAAFAAPSGTPTDGQPLLIRIKDNGTARALTWDAIYRVIGTTLPTTTVVSKTLYIGCIYNAADSKWDVLGVNQQA